MVFINTYFPALTNLWKKPQKFKHVVTPSNPNSGELIVYAKNDDKMYCKDSAGVEAEIGGLGGLDNFIPFKQNVVNTTTANITLSGEQTIDGILTATSRILVKDQTNAEENGIYLTGTGAWTRATDNDDNDKMTSGICIPIQSGTVNANKIFMLTTIEPITLDTTTLVFTEMGGAIGSNAILANAIIAAKIASNAVTSSKILADAIVTTKILNLAVTNAKLAGSIALSKLLTPPEANSTADQTNAEIETAYNAQVTAMSQAQAEAGTNTAIQRVTAQRIKQAVNALASSTFSKQSDVLTGDQNTTSTTFVNTNLSLTLANRTGGIFIASGFFSIGQNNTGQQGYCRFVDGSTNIEGVGLVAPDTSFHPCSGFTNGDLDGDVLKVQFRTSAGTMELRQFGDAISQIRVQEIS